MNCLDAIRRIGAALEDLHRKGGPGIWTSQQVEAVSRVTPAWQGRLFASTAVIREIGRYASLGHVTEIGIMPRRSNLGTIGWETGAPLLQPSGRPWAYASDSKLGCKSAELRGEAVCGFRCLTSDAGNFAQRQDEQLVGWLYPAYLDAIWEWMACLHGTLPKVWQCSGAITVIGKRVKGFALATAVYNAEERWWTGAKW